MSDKAFVCERCGNLKPMAYAGIRELDFCKCGAPTTLARLMAENEQLRAIIIPRYKFLMKLFEDGCYMNEQEKSDLADMAPLLTEAALKGEPK